MVSTAPMREQDLIEELEHLSLQAHHRALERNQLTPSERTEWMHHPMKFFYGVPVFDAGRMRPDQVWDVTSVLSDVVSRYKPAYGGTRGAVQQFVSVYGRTGVRLQDVIAEVNATKPIVLKYLRELVDEGIVKVVEENTRGKSASRRKRYYLVTDTGGDMISVNEDGFPVDDRGRDIVHMVDNIAVNSRLNYTAQTQNDSSGIIHHGTAAHSVVCPCTPCQWAFEEAILGDMVSESRRRGDTGFSVGLRWRTIQRRRAA